ncbi:Adenosylcobinamide kinase [Candidatus Hodgkinia cicadicola]|uniref:Adenosylcobinamide kinase n=1 Tax=Candidatus Hodgkinia cicadicola TaxID=573658 RepID=A0ABX4MIX9_9HYPH|nr:Adenosylcobinamide kinase [Candidatus Hodgkinia cicadicola]PIM95675.1 Adenosylcobinamide kinase [Candidatus Hodgkinia cicadicola]
MLLIGLQKTGKSRIIRSICSNLKTLYVVTNSTNIKDKLFQHIKYKSNDWNIYEESVNLIELIKITVNMDTIIIIDDISTWLINIMMLKSNCYNEIDKLLMLLKKTKHWIVITHELNKNISTNSLNTKFTKILWNMTQQLMLISNQIYISISGNILRLK